MQSPPHGAPARAAEPGRRHDPCPYVTRCRCARDARASARAARTDGVVDGVQRRQPRRPPRPRRGACGELVEQLELSGARAHSCCHDCDAARRKRTHSCDTCETARRALRERGAAPCRARGRTSSATWRSGCSSRRARASRFYASPATPRPFAARGQAEARGHAPRLRPVHEPRRRRRHRAGLADREKRDRHRRHPRRARRVPSPSSPRRSRAAPQATPSRTSSSWSEKRRSTDARATSSARRGIKSDVT